MTDEASVITAAALVVDDHKNVARLKEWSRCRPNKGEGKAFGDDPAVVAAATKAVLECATGLAELDIEQCRRAQRVLHPLLREATARLKSLGIATFAALLHEARELLVGSTRVVRAVRSSLDLLLVDEVQDTDPIQFEIVRRLAVDEVADSVPPSLFLVGDPKQSIYGWRNADLAAYERFAKLVIDGAGGELHRLSVNFRSVPAILDEVERVIEPTMREKPGLQPRFEPLAPSVENENETGFSEGDHRPIEYVVAWDRSDVRKTKSDHATEIEARAIAREISELTASGAAAFGDFAILMRTRGPLPAYLDALRREQVPYVVDRDTGYYRRREIVDAASAVRCVLDPNDHIALVAFMRSPIVGVPDAALVPLWTDEFLDLITKLHGPSGDRIEKLDVCIEAAAAVTPAVGGVDRLPEWPQALRTAVRHLAVLRRSYRDDAPDVFVERMRGLLLSEGIEAARHLGKHRQANLGRFFRELEDGLATHPGGPWALLRELREDVEDSRDMEEASPGDDALPAVRVMTVHVAKGLTFEHVYLVGAHKGSGGQQKKNDILRGEDRRHFRFFEASSIGYLAAEARSEAVAHAELVRTLYVAMTRPRRRLVIAGSWGAATKTLETAESYVDLLASRAAGEETASLEEKMSAVDAEDPVEVVDAVGARWWAPPTMTEPARVAPAAGEAIDVAVLRVRARRLDLAREEAAARQERRLVDSPSEGEIADSLDSDEESPRMGRGFGRDAATASGTFIHSVLEEWDTDADVSAELERHRDGLDTRVAALARRDVDKACAAAREILDRLDGSDCVARLRELGPCILGREVPFCASPPSEDDGPVGAVAGTVDMIYRDPQNGEVVVVDYKTDRVAPGDAEARANDHSDQLGAYRDAVARALGEPVRGELWFLHADRIVTLPTG